MESEGGEWRVKSEGSGCLVQGQGVCAGCVV